MFKHKSKLNILGLFFVIIGLLCNKWLLELLFSPEVQIRFIIDLIPLIIFELVMIIIGMKIYFSRNPKNIILIVSFNIIFGAILLMIIEGFFGSWFNPDKKIRNLNIPISQKIRIDVSPFYDRKNPIIEYYRDSNGFRGSYTDPSKIDILTIGGSTTAQVYIPDGETWQDVLSRYFRESGNQVTVVNAGIAGQTTIGHLRNFDWWFPNIPVLKPKYILYYIGINEVFAENNQGFDNFKNTSTLQYIKDNSAIYNLIRTLRNWYAAVYIYKIDQVRTVDDKVDQWTTTPLLSDYSYFSGQRLAELTKRLDNLISKSKAMKATPIFITQPTRYYRHYNNIVEGTRETIQFNSMSLNGLDYFNIKTMIDAEIKKIAQKNSIICINLANAEVWNKEDYFDFMHMTPSGTEKVGKLLFDSLNVYIKSGNINFCRTDK